MKYFFELFRHEQENETGKEQFVLVVFEDTLVYNPLKCKFVPQKVYSRFELSRERNGATIDTIEKCKSLHELQFDEHLNPIEHETVRL